MYFKVCKQEGEKILADLADELGCSGNMDRAYRTLKSVLGAYRNRLDFERSLNLLDALPLCLKSIYVDHWQLASPQPGELPNMLELIAEARRLDKRSSIQDFTTDLEAQIAIFAVFKTVREHLSDQEFKAIIDILTPLMPLY